MKRAHLKQKNVNAYTKEIRMPKFRAQFDSNRSGTIIFDADNADHAREIYEGLISGDTYPDEIEAYEDTEVSDTTYYELTDNSGMHLAD